MKANLSFRSSQEYNLGNHNKNKNEPAKLLLKGTAAIAGGTTLGLAINKIQDGENILKKDVLKSLFKIKEFAPFMNKVPLVGASVLMLQCCAAILDQEKNREKGKNNIKKFILGTPLAVCAGYSSWGLVSPESFKSAAKGLTLGACAYIPASILAMRSANKVFSDKKSQSLSEADPNKSLDIKNA